MRVLSRYILKEHIGPFLFSFCVVTFVLILDFVPNVIDMAIGKDIDLLTILWVFVLNLAWMLALSVPMATLVASLTAFGRLQSDFEVLAIKSSGIHLITLIRPVLIASVFLAAGMVWFNNEVLPDANHKARVLMSDIRVMRPTLSIKSNIFLNDIPGYVILIKKIDHKTSRIKDVTIFDQKDPRNPRIILAQEGELEYLEGGTVLSFVLEDGEIHEPVGNDPEKWRWVKFEKQTFNIRDISRSLKRTDSSYRGDREQSAEDMLVEIRKWRERIRKTDMLSFRRVDDEGRRLFYGLTRDESVETDVFKRKAVILAYQRAADVAKSLEQSIKNKDHTEHLVNTYLLEVHKKYSLPAACIVFVLIGAPLGIMAQRGGMAVSIGISIALFIVYWAFLIGGEEISDRGFLSPAVTMWAANVLLGGVGLLLLLKVMTEKELTRFSTYFGRKPRR
ncbi:MAG: LptF/LptG family permease [candidate division Zixibacteria bacterium]|nr:LptF/LptG family permease [candidate division Zixibacteria bacterium]MBU2625818.1 LptF/LptG family permease [candidate division Zixibacteria bacterium]